MGFLKFLWVYFRKISFFIGDIISGIILFIFYFTVFALFAIPFKLFAKPLQVFSKYSNWIAKEKNSQILIDFQNE